MHCYHWIGFVFNLFLAAKRDDSVGVQVENQETDLVCAEFTQQTQRNWIPQSSQTKYITETAFYSQLALKIAKKMFTLLQLFSASTCMSYTSFRLVYHM